MANRTISTKLAISGESEYRASLSRINTELKTLQSALKLTESQYQTNANSMQALEAKGQALNNLYASQKSKVQELRSALDNAKQAEDQYAQRKAEIQKKIEENNRALEKLKQTTGDTSKEEAKLTEENAKLHKELAEVDAKLQAAEKGTNSWQTQLNNAEVQLNNLDAEIQKNDKYLDEAAKSSDECATSIDEFGKEVDDTADSVSNLSEILASAELQKFGQSIAEVLSGCVKASMDFESQMAAVKRTTGMSDAELQSIGNSFKNLSTEIPITTQELAKIAENAGQLGIAKENVEQFSIVMAKLATTTDLTADAAATMLAQFANITGIKSADDYERLGSVVAALGDSTATTASKVVDMGQGMAAAASLAGMSSTDILAVSAAVGSLGIEAAAGSTAMSTLISSLYKATQSGGESLENFASVAGMSASEFKAAWGEDAVGALNAFITGLNDTERNGQSAIMILDDLGITNVRQTKAILGLASAGDLLATCIEKGNAAWEENTALGEKAGIMYNTLEAKTKELDSASNNLKIAIGDTLAPLLGNLAEAGTDVLKVMTDFVQKHPALTEALTLIAAGVAGITTAFAALKTAQKVADILGLLEPLKNLAAAAELAGGGISGLVAAFGTIAVPAAAAATAVLGLVTVIDRIKTSKEIGLLGEGHELEEYAQNVDNYRQEIERCKQNIDDLAQSGGDLTMAYDELSLMETALRNATEEYTKAQEAANQAQEEGVETSQEAGQAAQLQAILQEELSGQITSLAESYQKAYYACRESLDGQIGLFDNFAKSIAEETDTAKEMLDLWAQQTANLGEYTENLKRAGELGLDTGLVQSLADGSTQSAGYLSTIITEIDKCAEGTGTLGSSAEEAVAKFNEAFNQTEQAKDTLAQVMTGINADLESALRTMEQTAADINFDGFWDAVDMAFKDIGVEFKEIGVNMGKGSQEGINESAGDVAAAAEDMVAQTVDAAKAEAGVASPSTVFREIGMNLDEGLKEGIADGTTGVTGAVQSMVGDLNETMREGSQEAVTGFVDSFSMISDQAQGVLTNLVAVIQGSTAGLPWEMYSVGVGIIDGMISGLNSRSGALYSTISSIVNQAISTARSSAGVASPSKKTKEIFEYVGEGMIVGIESKKARVAEATADVAKNAVNLDTSGLERVMQNQFRGEMAVMGMVGDRTSRDVGGVTTINNNFEITVPNMVVREEADIRKVSEELGFLIRQEQRRRGHQW